MFTKVTSFVTFATTSIIWLLVTNAKSSTWAPLQQNSRFVFVTINHQCLRTEEHVSWRSIIILLSIKFVKLVLLLSNKLKTTKMQPILNNCSSPEKHIGPHNSFHYIHTVLTKGVNSNPKIVSATTVDFVSIVV